MQDSAGIHSSGHVLLDNKTVCGETWDLAASQVVYMRVFLLGIITAHLTSTEIFIDNKIKNICDGI